MSPKRFTPSHAWVSYFKSNAEAATATPRPPATETLPAPLRRLVEKSLTAWQLGATSEGHHFRKAARQYANRHEDPDFLLAVEYFIREEQRHGAALGDWLDRVGVPRRKSDLGDSLFRFCRYAIPNYAVWASVVVMVEAMAELYYHALSRLIPCPRLKTECQIILRDEVRHIQFQCEHLAYTRQNLPRGLLADLRILEILFYTVVCTAVWIAHGPVFRASGVSLRLFSRFAKRKFLFMQDLMRPERYAFDQTFLRPCPAPARSAVLGLPGTV